MCTVLLKDQGTVGVQGGRGKKDKEYANKNKEERI